MNERLELQFGAMCTPIKVQLEQQGVKLAVPRDAKKFQKLADSITMLAIHGILSDSAVRSCRQRLLNRIAKQVRQVERKEKTP
jgi:hypothetical protein